MMDFRESRALTCKMATMGPVGSHIWATGDKGPFAAIGDVSRPLSLPPTSTSISSTASAFRWGNQGGLPPQQHPQGWTTTTSNGYYSHHYHYRHHTPSAKLHAHGHTPLGREPTAWTPHYPAHYSASYPCQQQYQPRNNMEVLLNRPASHQPSSATSIHNNVRPQSQLLNPNNGSLDLCFPPVPTQQQHQYHASRPHQLPHTPFSADCAMLSFAKHHYEGSQDLATPCSAPLPLDFNLKQQPPSRTPSPTNVANDQPPPAPINLPNPLHEAKMGGAVNERPGSAIPVSIHSALANGISPTQLGGAGGGVDTNITLWQFLLELLASNEHSHLIQWSNTEGEFKLLDAEAVARLWGTRKGKPQMNYDKLSRALRYYYDKNIIKKVTGQKFVYRFESVRLAQGGLYGAVPELGGGHSNAAMLYAMSRSNAMAAAAVASVIDETRHPCEEFSSTLSTSSDRCSLVPAMSTNHALAHPHPSQSSDACHHQPPPGDETKPVLRKISPPAIEERLTNNTSCLRQAMTTTPSPNNSACSPGSIGSSSGVSSAGTAASNLSELVGRTLANNSSLNPTFIVPATSIARVARPSSSSSSSRIGCRKRKSEFPERPYSNHNPSSLFLRPDARETSAYSTFMGSQGPAAHVPVSSAPNGITLADGDERKQEAPALGAVGSLSCRRSIPKPLDLTSVNSGSSNLNTLSNLTSSMHSLMAVASSPLLNPPLLNSNSNNNLQLGSTLSPALVYAAASSLSSGLIPPQSPLGQYAASVLAASPSLAIYAAAAAASPLISNAATAGMGLNPLSSLNGIGNGGCLSSLSTPICQRTPTQPGPSVMQLAAAIASASSTLASLTPQHAQQVQQQQQQHHVFQFPPTGTGAGGLPAALTLAMLNSPNVHSPSAFNAVLATTPTAQGKGFNRSPESLKTPIASSLHHISFQDQFTALAAANLKKG